MAVTQDVIAYLQAIDVNFSDNMNDAANATKGFSGKVGSAMGKIASVAATAMKAASVAVAGFVAYGVKSASELTVMNAQYDQMFADVKDSADKQFGELADKIGSNVNRLKEPSAKFQSFFKASGLSSKESLGMTVDAMEVAADSAAFFDTSLEDSAASLKSFMMGNYEAGDAIGINTNATKIAAWNTKKYGDKFADLSDAVQQTRLLEFVKETQKASGVTGQAAREMDSWENVMGNLKSSFQELSGTIAMPIFNAIIQGGKKLNDVLMKLVPMVKEFYENFKNSKSMETAKEVIDRIKLSIQEWANDGGTDRIREAFQKFGDFLMNIDFVAIFEGISTAVKVVWTVFKTVAPVVVALWAAFKTYKIVVAVQAAISVMTTIFTSLSVILPIVRTAFMAFVTGLNPVGLAIAAVIAVVVLLYTKWDSIFGLLKKITKVVFNAIKLAIEVTMDTIKTVIDTILPAIKRVFVTVWNAIKAVTSKVWNGIKSVITTVIKVVKTIVTTYFKVYKTIILAVWNTISKATEKVWGILKKVVSTVTNFLKNSIKNGFEKMKSNITTVWQTVKKITSTVWNAIKNVVSTMISNIKNNISKVFSAIKNTITTVWKAIKTVSSTVWTAIKNTVIRLVSALKTGIKTAFTRAKEIVSGLVRKIKETTVTVFRNMVSSAKNIVNGIKDAVKNAFSKAMSAAKGFFGTARGIGKDLIMGFVNGVKQFAHKLVDAVVAPVKGAMDKAKSLLGIHSPSRVFKSYGEYTMEGYEIGVDKNAWRMGDSISNAIDGIPTNYDIMGTAKASTAYSTPNVATGNNSAYINLQMGNNTFGAFVNDVTSQQGKASLMRKSL